MGWREDAGWRAGARILSRTHITAAVVSAGEQFHERFASVYFRALARLAFIASQVERLAKLRSGNTDGQPKGEPPGSR